MSICDRCKDDLSELDHVLCDGCKEKEYLEDIKQARLQALQECREIAEREKEPAHQRSQEHLRDGDQGGMEFFNGQFVAFNKMKNAIDSLISEEGEE